MMNEETDESSTVISYYLLYQKLSRKSENTEDGRQCEEDKGNKRLPNNDDTTQSFWAVDEWTDLEKEETRLLLKKNEEKCSVPLHRKIKYEKGAARYWDNFYESHGTNFFKDRHYLKKAFPEEFGGEASHKSKSLVEIGSGVGNNILPLLDDYPNWKVWGYDLSKVAVELMKKDPRFDNSRATGEVWDISKEDTSPPVLNVADVCTLLFCLSAIAPEKMAIAANNTVATLKPAGILVFRDYGRYDEAQIKLGTNRAKRLGDNFYVKSDGTRCYYFSLQDIKEIFVEKAGLEILELKYVQRIYQNRATDEKRRRVWVQGRFRKPVVSSTI